MFSSFIYLYNELAPLQNFCSYFKQSKMPRAIDLESYKAEIISSYGVLAFGHSALHRLVVRALCTAP